MASLTLAAGTLTLTILQRDYGFPASVATIPLLVVFATLVAGPRHRDLAPQASLAPGTVSSCPGNTSRP